MTSPTDPTKAAIEAVNELYAWTPKMDGTPDEFFAHQLVFSRLHARAAELAFVLLRSPAIQARLLGRVVDREAVVRIVGAVAVNGALCGWAVDELLALLSPAPTTPAGRPE